MRIKTVRQLDETDCGAACIATVLKYYGRSVPIRKIRKEAGTDKIGTSGFGIIKAAKKYGLSCKGFSSPDKSKIVKIPLPAIFHTQQGADHYMVVYKVSNKNVFVCDPAIGTRKIDHEEFNKIWTGVFFILFPLEEFKKGREETGLALTFLSLLRPYKGLIIKIFLASVLLSFFGIFISFYFRFIIDEVLYSQIKSTLNLCSLCYLLVIIFQAILVFCRNQIILYLGAKIDVRLVSSFFCHLLHLPLDYFSSRKTGEILSRINDANIVKNAISSATISVVLDAFLLVFGGFFLVKMGSSLLPVAIVPVLISAGIVYMFSKKLKFKIRERAIIEADKNATMYESINGIATLKGLSTEDLAFERTEEKIVESATKTVELGQLNNIQHSMQEIVSGAGKLALYWLGSFLIFDGKITLGQLISFVTLSGFFLDPLRRLLTMQLYFQEVWMSAQRLFDVIDMEEENNNAEEKNTDLDLYGDIEFKNVSFAYGTRGFAVEDVSLSIPAGKKVAFVGMSGSGKSTLLKLLMKFYKNMSGKILVNGIDIAEIQTDYYRNQIGYVPQESLLFSGTIKDNIAWGASDADMSQIFEAASSSRSVDFIEHLPEKFNTYVGEQGATLSGGERQRIAIARILMRNPKIIILDEATASLDSISEKLIMNTIYNTIQNKSVIMVAHRLSTVKNCDKIFVFNSGKLVEEGNHTELLQKKGFYYQLWSAQNDGIEAVSA